MPSVRRAGAVVALIAPVALAYRFALIYRARAGFPRRRWPSATPADLGLPFEEIPVASAAGMLPAWFIPARGGERGPGVILVHGWESGRDRTLPHAAFLHAAGFHVLTLDVRGHGGNPPERLPITGGEFAADAVAGLDAILARPEVTVAGILGHSLGGIGALIAAAGHPGASAVVSVSAPADPYRLTRLTFRLARLPLPDPVAYPLAAVTAHLFVRPRRHRLRQVSATIAARRYRGPLLLVHGTADEVVPLAHHAHLVAAARSGRRRLADAAPVETYVVTGGAHSWLYEHEDYRRVVAAFLARALGGPFPPAEAAALAAAVDARRLPDVEQPFAGVPARHTRLRTVAEILGAPVRALATEPLPPAPSDPWPTTAEPPLSTIEPRSSP
jgi:dipeptidyl aminopeptidase/acylaminoacyl peptidase